MNPIPRRYLDSIYYRGTDLWPQLAGKRIFVAGDTGFYGSWFVGFIRYLREIHGITVLVSGGSRQTGWDITKPVETFTNAQCSADYLINCAGSSAAGQSEADLLQTHVVGPVNLANHKRADCVMLQISSGAVSVESNTGYARAKAMGEHMLRSMCRNLQIVRPFATVGPLMPLNSGFAIPTFIRQTMAGEMLHVSNTCQRSFCHITDLLVQIFHVMITGDGQPYDVGSDDLITMEQAASTITDQFVLTPDHEFLTNADTSSYSADLARVGRDVEARTLSRAVALHAESRVLLNGRRTVVFS